ncbi:MAG: RNA polymerase sigma factor [candidate division Zixibacteria bacterium]|nr:RNA polymerase sigma factor [candidate division Zixibacteria bacterium]
MNERELILAAQSGDFDAFSKLIGEYKDKIYRLALKLSNNREDAEDIVQETFLKAVDNIDKFRLESSFGTWLYSIALNHFRSDAVKDKRMDLKPIEEYLPESHNEDISNLYDWGDPHHHFENKQIMEIIEAGLAEMKHIYSGPFILRYMEDMPVKDVAEIFNLSVPATKSRILRARLALRDRLSQSFQEN